MITTSNPDDVVRLKATVELYEKELRDEVERLATLGKTDVSKVNPNILAGIGLDAVGRIIDLNGKLLDAYRGYVMILERLVPR